MDAETGKKNRVRKITTNRKLHSSGPYWATTPRSSVPAKDEPKSSLYDVIIVGAGISGALSAQALAEAGKSVLVIDKSEAARGSTAASTAMIQHEIDVPLQELQKSIGVAKANRAWRRSAKAVNDLAELVGRLGIDCDFQKKQTLYIAGDLLGSRALKTEAACRVKAGLEAEFLDAKTLLKDYGLQRTGAIRTVDSASANPTQLTAGLLKNAVAYGAEIMSGIEISDLVETREQVILATANGKLLEAGYVIFATGYEYLKVLEHPDHQVISTWAIASKPGLAHPQWLDDYLVWEASDPYLYFRTTPDGRIVVGGEDEDGPQAHADTGKMLRKVQTIRKKLLALTGVDIGKPEFDWAAPFGTTTTGLPFIDRLPGKKRTMTIMGFGGNGITFSMIAAQINAAYILGRVDRDANLFSFPA